MNEWTCISIFLHVCLCVCYLTVWVPSCMTRRCAGMTFRCLHIPHICLRPNCCTAPHRSPQAGREQRFKDLRRLGCSSKWKWKQNKRNSIFFFFISNSINNEVTTRVVGYLTCSFYTDSMVLGITAEGTIVGGNKQLSLTTDCCTLQVTWLIGDADVISYTRNYMFILKYLYMYIYYWPCSYWWLLLQAVSPVTSSSKLKLSHWLDLVRLSLSSPQLKENNTKKPQTNKKPSWYSAKV